jgi:hypothetical protein
VIEAGGVPCTIEAQGREWVVTLASATIARSENLTLAIERADGGLVYRVEAKALAAAIANDEKAQRALEN